MPMRTTRKARESGGSNQNFPFEKLRNELQKIHLAIVGTHSFPVYTDGTRPSAAAKPAGYCFFNSSDNFLNCSDGANWRDPTGAVT